MELAGLLYNYERGDVSLKSAIQAKLEQDSMTPLYEQSCAKFSWEVDASLLESMK